MVSLNRNGGLRKSTEELGMVARFAPHLLARGSFVVMQLLVVRELLTFSYCAFLAAIHLSLRLSTLENIKNTVILDHHLY